MADRRRSATGAADAGGAASLAKLAQDLAIGATTSLELVEACLARIEADDGTGHAAFTKVFRGSALAAAAASDLMRANGLAPSPLAGVPISVKDLFDVAGKPTTAGSPLRTQAPPAPADAPVVARLRASGAVIVGRTNMTELAYSGLGLNPHFGTPRNPFDPGLVPGGSSSGAAASVAWDYAAAAVGTDTAGSVRIPAAFCGLVGLKPTQGRIPREGVTPLSRSLDSVGAIGRSIACCALLNAVMSGRPLPQPRPISLVGVRVLVPRGRLTDGLDRDVGQAFERTLSRLSAAGARLVEEPLPAEAMIADIEALGGLIGPEAFAEHGGLLDGDCRAMDPCVLGRLREVAAAPAGAYLAATRLRTAAVTAFSAGAAGFDAILAPTSPVTPPRLAALATERAYRAANRQVLRNTLLVNLVDGCAATLPCQTPGEPPVGLMVLGARDADDRIIDIAGAVEQLLRRQAR
jgi:aspartyl-tRNA(Asn)/glutamyl-tRNA(Gln) amidotransferase subunit A